MSRNEIYVKILDFLSVCEKHKRKYICTVENRPIHDNVELVHGIAIKVNSRNCIRNG